MRDVTEQLTAYFDATVERVTAEDVLAGAEVRSQNGRLAPTRVPRLRPAWVVAAGFVATIVLIGGAVGIARLLERESGEVGAPPPIGDAGDGLAGPWALLIAAGVVLVLAVAGLAVRGRREIVKEQDMQTLDRPEVEVSPRPRSPAILVLIVALLVLAAGALGWWLGSGSDDVGDMPQIVDLWNQAWVDGDADAVAALHAEDGIFTNAAIDEGVPQDRQFVGRIRIAMLAKESLGLADFEALSVDNLTVLDNVIAFEWTASGMSGSQSPSQRDPFETTGLTVLELEDGLVLRSTTFYDRAELYNLP